MQRTKYWIWHRIPVHGGYIYSQLFIFLWDRAPHLIREMWYSLAMTNPWDVHVSYSFSALLLIQYHGDALASSLYWYFSAKDAFFGGPDHFWASSSDEPLPVSIWFRFEEAQSLAKIGFSSRPGGHLDQTPVHFLVIASMTTNGKCTDWTTLLEVKNAGFTQNGEFRSWLIPARNRQPFQCIGLEILATLETKPKASLARITTWEWEGKNWKMTNLCLTDVIECLQAIFKRTLSMNCA